MGSESVRVEVAPGLNVRCEVDDFLWPWEKPAPAVLVHGFARNADCWRRWVPRLAEHRRVYRPELRGFGGSDVPPEGFEFDTEMLLGDFRAVFDRLGIERAHVAGDSSGGLLALLFAARYPERVATLVLCDTPAKGTESSTPGIRAIYAQGEANTPAAIVKYGMEEWCRRTLPYRLDLEKAPPEMQDWYVREIGKTPRHVAAALNAYLHPAGKPGPATLVRPVGIPVLLLAGEGSKLSGDQQEAFLRELPQGRLRIFAGYGHGVAVIAAEACAEAAAAFWDEVDDRAVRS